MPRTLLALAAAALALAAAATPSRQPVAPFHAMLQQAMENATE